MADSCFQLSALPNLSHCNVQKAVFPIAAADPPSLEGQNYYYYPSAEDGFRFNPLQRMGGQLSYAVL